MSNLRFGEYVKIRNRSEEATVYDGTHAVGVIEKWANGDVLFNASPELFEADALNQIADEMRRIERQ